jgi:hypothetical protein
MTNAELQLCRWQFRRFMDTFSHKLFELIAKADEANLRRIGEGFPDETAAYRRFGNETDYWKQLEQEYLNSIEGKQ